MNFRPARNQDMDSGRIRSLLASILIISTFSGCLQTRGDIAEEDEQKKIQTTVSNLQRSHADEDARFDGVDSTLRELTGRIETDEHKNSVVHENYKTSLLAQQKKIDEILAQMKIFDETLLKAHQRLDSLERQLAATQEAALAANNSEKESKSKSDHFQDGEQHFNAKEWKKAISAYQKYRDANPKGKEQAVATLRIGIAFQELGMKSEAKSFYQEVLEKYPKEKAAKTAINRMKLLKK